MSKDYLWDKTGEPDPEIERLEQVLGTLRYKPKPFQIPSEVPARSSSRFRSLLAIAAAISVIVAGGLWLTLHRAADGVIARVELPLEPPQRPLVVDIVGQPSINAGQPVVRYKKPIPHRREPSENELAERKEAAAAKEQLMLALRLTSSKLSLAQKRAQGAPTIIRNQHKVG
jgi:hypothetical protein